MHIADVTITNKWTKFTDIIKKPIQEDVTYTVVNSSPNRLYAVESTGKPADETVGVFVEEGRTIIYKKGTQDLYLKNGRAGNNTESYACVNMEG